MRNRFYFFFFFWALCSIQMAAQTELSVSEFNTLQNDMSARTTAPVRDANGDLTALIKVVTTETGFDFDGGSLGIVKVEQHPGEIWVYVPDRARTMTIRHSRLGVLRNYAYPISVKSGNVYEMKLVHGTIEMVVKDIEIITEWVVIASDPSGADVYINNNPVGKTPYSAELPVGEYQWRVERTLYQTQAGVADLAEGERISLDLQLRPDFGTIDLSSTPEQGARVLLNGIDIGKETPCVIDELPKGSYTVTLSHQWYETTTETYDVEADRRIDAAVAMKPTFGILKLSPAEEEVSYYLNDRKLESEETEMRLAPGVYTLEARKEHHKTERKRLTVEQGETLSPELEPEPLLGNLRIQTEPFGVEVLIDGKRYGESPYTAKDLLIGEHLLELKKDGYKSIRKTVTLAEDETLDVTETLEKGASASTDDGASEMLSRANSTVDAASEAKARDIIDKYFQALGGLDKLEAIQTYRESGVFEMEGMNLPYTLQTKKPDKLRMVMSMSSMVLYDTIVSDGEGMNKVSGDASEMSQEQINDFLLQYDKLALHKLKQLGASYSYAGENVFKGTPVHSIDIQYGAETEVTLHFAKDSGLLAGSESSLENESGTFNTYTVIEGYFESGGIMVPRKTVYYFDDKTQMLMITNSAEINVSISDSEFNF